VLASLNLLRFASRLRFPIQSPPFMPTVMLAFLVACAVWGICTGIGLFWHRRWARISIQLFGVVLILISLPQVFGVLMARARVPVSWKASTLAPYLAQIVISVWWLVLFNVRGTKEAFNVRNR
jgi:hypothetical protein